MNSFVAKARKLLQFAAGQGAVQALGLLNGFLLLRWLSVEQYAIFTLVNGFLGTVAVLVEMGLATSLVALLAGRTDARTVGEYIRSVRHYRNIFLAAATPFIAAVFVALTMRQGWSLGLTVCLLALIILMTFFQSWTNYYSVPFIIRHDMYRLYRVSAALSALRLIGSYVLFLSGLIGAVAVSLLTTATTAAMGWIYRRQASPLIEEPKFSEPSKNKEVLGFVRPLVPSTLFYAFQGQIGVLLITWFGKEQGIAEIGALGRIAQIFVLLAAFNSVVLAPFIAKVPRNVLLKRYLQVVGGATLLCAVLLGIGFFTPNLLLWLIGPKYSHLSSEMGWLLLSSCVGFINGVMWTIHSARNWIFAWAAWAYIAAVVAVQIVCLLTMELDTVRGVLLFSAYSSLATTAVYVAWAIVGFREVQP